MEFGARHMPEIIQLGLAEPGGHSVSPDSRHMCVSLLFSQGWGGGEPSGSHGNFGCAWTGLLHNGTFTFMCIRKNSPTNLDFY